MEANISSALSLSFAGISIVFGSLIMIAVAVRVMRATDEWLENKKLTENKTEPEKEQTLDNLTLVLISAAVAAKLQKRKYAIRSVRRLVSRDATIAGWTMEGRSVLHGSHVINIKQDK